MTFLPLTLLPGTRKWRDWTGGGGGGYFHICMHVGYVPRERPPFSALNFRFGAYHFHKITKNPFRSITILIFLADFAVPETIIFKMSLISTRSSPPTAGSARTQSVRQRRGLVAVPEIRIFTLKRIKLVPEPCIFTLKTAQARSGAPHFQARSGALVNLGWVSPPPPPRRGFIYRRSFCFNDF